MNNKAIALALAALVALPATAQDDVEHVFRIAYEVSIPDEDAKKRVGMYVRNELRNLGDVAVTDEDPDYKLYVMVLEMKSERGTRLAYVLGISVTSYFPDGYFNTVLDDRLRNIGDVAARLEEVPVYEQQLMSVSGPGEAHLIETVAGAIGKLNRHILQPQRQATRDAEEP